MPEQCNDCPLEPRVDALERANEQHGRTHRDMFDRLNRLEMQNAVQDERHKAVMDKLDEIKMKYDALYARIDEIAKNSALQAQSLHELNERSKKNQERLDALEKKPIKRMDTAIAAVITAVIGAIIGALAVKFGLK